MVRVCNFLAIESAKQTQQPMTRIQYHLTPHAKDETIPLRTGLILKWNKVFLDEIEVDEEGTAQQTKSQRDAGNYHILANVWLSQSGDENCLGRWRLVTRDQDFQDPPIFTLLPLDRGSARSEANLTDYLKKEREKPDRLWLNPEYIAKTLHPLLLQGTIRNQNDLASHINDRLLRPILVAKHIAEQRSAEAILARDHAQIERDQAKEEMERAAKAQEDAERKLLTAVQEKNAAEEQWGEEYQAREVAEREKQDVENKLAKVIDERDQLAQALARADELSKSKEGLSTLSEGARAVTRPWTSKTGSDYKNIGIEATIEDVRQIGSKISLTYRDKSGNSQTVNDFGYYGFVQLVYDYLKSCRDEKRRAVFILTYRPDMKMRLASDTMMLANYVSLWRK